MKPGQNRPRTLLISAAVLLGSLALFGLGIRQLFRFARTPVYRLHMVTDPVPNRQILARRMASEAHERKLEIELTTRSYPSLEVLKLVNGANEFDAAMVPGGVGSSARFPNVRQVAALGTDPLHVMVKPELFEAASRGLGRSRASGSTAGRRRRCCGSWWRTCSGSPACGRRRRRPRAITATSPPRRRTCSPGWTRSRPAPPPSGPSPSPGSLMPCCSCRRSPRCWRAAWSRWPDYRLVPLAFTEAYTLDRLNLHSDPDEPDALTVDRASIVAATIPPDLYGTDPPVPAEPCHTLGTRLLLVAYSKTDPEAVARLLEVIYDSPLAGLIRPLPLHEQVPQFDLDAGTELYLRRRQPVLTPDMVSQLGKLFGGLGAFASGIVGLYGFLRIRQLRKFEDFYYEVRRIVQISRGQADDPAAPTEPEARRAYLLGRLDDLKSEAVRQFAEGGLKGEGLLSGVVALINDTRDSLAGADRGSHLGTVPPDGPSVRDFSAAGTD